MFWSPHMAHAQFVVVEMRLKVSLREDGLFCLLTYMGNQQRLTFSSAILNNMNLGPKVQQVRSSQVCYRYTISLSLLYIGQWVTILTVGAGPSPVCTSESIWFDFGLLLCTPRGFRKSWCHHFRHGQFAGNGPEVWPEGSKFNFLKRGHVIHRWNGNFT